MFTKNKTPSKARQQGPGSMRVLVSIFIYLMAGTIAVYLSVFIVIYFLGDISNFSVCNDGSEPEFVAKESEFGNNCCQIESKCVNHSIPVLRGMYCTINKTRADCNRVSRVSSLNFMTGRHSLLLQPDFADLNSRSNLIGSKLRSAIIGRKTVAGNPISLIARPGFALNDEAITAAGFPGTIMRVRADESGSIFVELPKPVEVIVLGEPGNCDLTVGRYLVGSSTEGLYHGSGCVIVEKQYLARACKTRYSEELQYVRGLGFCQS